jgi:anti-sigma regulatory factor (Ser/Thr protein kinase)
MVPDDETARLAALRRYRILDTEPEQRFDDLAMLASQICGTPIALITLVDADRQWFKSRVGTRIAGTARSISFCTHAIRQREIFQVPDALADQRFRDSPLVTQEPNIRFYAGASLAAREGHALGSLCVIDHVPRSLTSDQEQALEALRRQVEAQLELRRSLLELETALAARDRAEEEQRRLVGELRDALDNVGKLSALVPLCSTCAFNMTIPADASAVSTISEGLEQMLRSKGWRDDDVIGVELAVREALTNAIRHGCKEDPSKQVQCLVSYGDPQEIVIVIRDPGPGFDTTALPDPLAPQNIFKASGRGVYLINQVMDSVGFGDGGRQVEMRKRRDARSAAGT